MDWKWWFLVWNFPHVLKCLFWQNTYKFTSCVNSTRVIRLRKSFFFLFWGNFPSCVHVSKLKWASFHFSTPSHLLRSSAVRRRGNMKSMNEHCVVSCMFITELVYQSQTTQRKRVNHDTKHRRAESRDEPNERWIEYNEEEIEITIQFINM